MTAHNSNEFNCSCKNAHNYYLGFWK